MRSRPLARNFAAVAGITGIIAIGALTAACGSESTDEPSTTPTTTSATTTPPAPPTSSAPPVAPTENQMDPTGGNKFTPTHVEPPPPPTGRRGYLPQG